MNMNTITQELNKKLEKMSPEDFGKFILKLIRVYEKHHGYGIQNEFTFYRKDVKW